MVMRWGDRYIRLFADQLKTLNRYGAVVERHSGDEFIAFLCGNGEEELAVFSVSCAPGRAQSA